MIYPKNKLSNAGASTVSRKTFTAAQKDEVRRQIVEKLSRRYGLDMVEQINQKVGLYVNNNTITAEGLQQLEQEIGKCKVQDKPLQNQQSTVKQRDDDDQKSVVSKMSGASNFDRVDQFTHKSEKNIEEKKSQKMTSLHPKRMENDLEFLNEENQWGAIYKYNKYLYDKEGDILKQREQERKQKIKAELDAQVREKAQKKVEKQREEHAFYENQLIQCQLFDQKEQEKAEKIERMKQVEKAARDKQVKEIRKMRRQEVKEEKQLDGYVISKIKEELDDEAQFQKFKKDHQYNVMQKLLIENEEKKRQTDQEKEDERLENIKLMEAYCTLLDKQEKERQKAMKERDEKIKATQLKALEMQEKELESIIKYIEIEKIGQLERRADKYEARKERRIQELEKEEEVKKWQTKLQTREYLTKQVEERDIMKQKEKLKDQEQATLWKEDTQNYYQFENQKEHEKKSIYKEYQNTLIDQMKQKQDVKRGIIDEAMKHEDMLSKKTLQEIDGMRQTGY